MVKQKTRGAARTPDTRGAILSAAARHFAARGFGGARVDQIARDAGVNKATIYYHIGNKAALYEQALSQVLGRIADQVEENVARAGSPPECLRAFVTTIAGNILASEHFSSMIMREVASQGRTLPADILKLMRRIMSTLRDILEQGERRGEFKKTDPVLLHLMIVGGINFYAAGGPVRSKIKRTGDRRGMKPRALGEAVAGIVLRGIESKRNGKQER